MNELISMEHGTTPEIQQFGILKPDVQYVLRPGGYAVIRDGRGRFAIVQVHRGHFLPGGGQDPDESAEQAAIREAYEECALRIRICSLIGIADQLVFAASEQTYFRKRCTFFLAELLAQHAGGEADHQLLWMPPQDAATAMSHQSQRWAVTEAIRLQTPDAQ